MKPAPVVSPDLAPIASRGSYTLYQRPRLPGPEWMNVKLIDHRTREQKPRGRRSWFLGWHPTKARFAEGHDLEWLARFEPEIVAWVAAVLDAREEELVAAWESRWGAEAEEWRRVTAAREKAERERTGEDLV